MAIAVLLLWLLTATAGIRLLVMALIRSRDRVPATPAARDAPAGPARAAGPVLRKPYDTEALARNRAQPMPGLRELGEFAHPALGITGLAFWLGYVVSHSRTLALIAAAIAVVTALAGLSWFSVNFRSARRGAADALLFSPRLALIHGSAAITTLALAVLTALTARS